MRRDFYAPEVQKNFFSKKNFFFSRERIFFQKNIFLQNNVFLPPKIFFLSNDSLFSIKNFLNKKLSNKKFYFD